MYLSLSCSLHAIRCKEAYRNDPTIKKKCYSKISAPNILLHWALIFEWNIFIGMIWKLDGRHIIPRQAAKCVTWGLKAQSHISSPFAMVEHFYFDRFLVMQRQSLICINCKRMPLISNAPCGPTIKCEHIFSQLRMPKSYELGLNHQKIWIDKVLLHSDVEDIILLE